MAKRGKDTLPAEEKKVLRARLKALEELMAAEVRYLVKERFDYQIAIAEVEKAGITTTGAACENELKKLSPEFRKYRVQNELWTSQNLFIEYSLVESKVKRVREEISKEGKKEMIECFL